jgi:hypothetical protein
LQQVLANFPWDGLRVDIFGQAEMTDALETARAAKKFLKAVGGPEQAKKCLEAYPEHIPVSVLTQWVEVLSD